MLPEHTYTHTYMHKHTYAYLHIHHTKLILTRQLCLTDILISCKRYINLLSEEYIRSTYIYTLRTMCYHSSSLIIVLTKTGTQLEPPGTIRNQLEPAENHLEPTGTGSE